MAREEAAARAAAHGAAAGDAALPAGHESWSPALSAALFPLLSFGALPLAALLLVELSRVYALLFLAQAALALAALEWSWLLFRVRARLLLALDSADADLEAPHVPTIDPNNASRPVMTGEGSRPAAYALRLQQAQRPAANAIAPLARRLCCSKWWLAALPIALLMAAVGEALAYWLVRDAFRGDAYGWRMVVGATAAAAGCSAWAGALAPAPGDAFVLAVYQAAVLAAAMNAFLRFRVPLLGDDDLVDALYVSLVAACAVVVFRVVSSRRVLPSLLLVAGDVLGLVMLVVPLATAADAVDRAPATAAYRQQLALFLVVLAATDMGDALARALQRHWPVVLLARCRQTPLAKRSAAATREMDAALLAWACAALTLGVARVAMGPAAFNAVEVVVLLLAVGVGQWARVWVDAVKRAANVTTTAFYLARGSRTPGALERMALFLVAIIVYYPYIKQRFIAHSVLSSSGSGDDSDLGQT